MLCILLGMEVKFFVVIDYNGVIEVLCVKKFDVVFFGLFFYVLVVFIVEVDFIVIFEIEK